MSVADQLIEQGEQAGLRKTLLKQLRLRFGALPQDLLDRVKTADLARLDLWLERVLTAPTLDEALRDA